MPIRHLSPEIVSLIHHVELNESGWWKKAIGQVIKGILWQSQTPLSQDELKAGLKREVGIQLSDDVLLRQVEILTSQSAVTRMPNLSYKLTESSRSASTSYRRTRTMSCRVSNGLRKSLPKLAARQSLG